MIIEAILQGIAAGLILSVFVGPIFFTMLQLGVEHGFKAAFALALGQWTSDFLYIFFAFWGAIWVEEIINNSAQQTNFVWYSGTMGGVLLLLFGIGLLFTKSVSTQGAESIKIPKQRTNVAHFAYFLQGLLINTINPTPLLFWMGLMAFAINNNYDRQASAVLFIVVMGIVVLTDCLKIALAHSIRNKLKAHHFLYVRRLAGLVLVGFGLVLLLKITLNIL